MKKILLPTDFSENSINAISYALKFFKDEMVTFYLMHAYENEFYDHEELVSRDVFKDVLEKTKRESEVNLEQLLQKVKSLTQNSKHSFHTISAYNTLVEEANIIVDSKNIDLIVMGTKGKSDERQIVFGSRTFQVLKYVQCPILVIPSGYINTEPKRILFPTNFIIPYKLRELELLSDIAMPNSSIIDVLYVSTSNKLSMRQEDNKSFIKKILCNVEVNVCHENSKKITDAIKTYIENKSIDMVTMVNTQHSFLEDMLFPSNIDKVSIDLKIPLLAMQNTTRL